MINNLIIGEKVMDDLLKEAIADAKAVRETALENARIALEEAFTPRLQSMLSKKIQSEMEVEEGEHEDEEEKEEGYHEDDEDPTDDASEAMHDDEEEKEEGMHDEDEDMEEMDEEMEGVIEIDGVKYAPVVAEEEDEEEDKDEMAHEGAHEDDEDDMDEELDLEAVLRELEEDTVDEVEEPVEEGEDKKDDDEVDESIEEGEDDEVEESVEEVDEEVDATTGIGSSDNKKGTADKSSGIGTKDKAKHNESVEVTEEKDEDDNEVDEDIDLDEIIAALSEEEKEDDEKNEVAELKGELDEHRNVVKYLRSKLNEVNLLNAKLLFTNKLFRSFGLTNDQKMKVVENFDRANNLREVKLVYSTLAESFVTKTTKTEIKESKGSASKAVASTKSEKQEQEVIAEGSELRDRFKKLAGIL